MLLKKYIFTLLPLSLLSLSLHAEPVNKTASLSVVLSYLLSDTDTSYYKPTQIVCEANGGDWDGDGTNECSAKWEDAMNVCSVPTQKQWESLIVGYGADLDEYDENNASYQAHYQNGGYLGDDLYWSTNVNGDTDEVFSADFSSGRIAEKSKTSYKYVRCTQGGKLLIPNVLPASQIYAKPPQIACEASGGDWNDTGHGECSARWDEASAICSLPTDLQWQSMITACGGDPTEYNDQNPLYSLCYANANYPPLTYWSSGQTRLDIIDGKTKAIDNDHNYIVRCLPDSLNNYRPTPESCEDAGGGWEEETNECSANWEDAMSICSMPTQEEYESIMIDCGANLGEYDEENTQYQECYQNSGYISDDLYWSTNVNSTTDGVFTAGFESGRISEEPKTKYKYVRCTK